MIVPTTSFTLTGRHRMLKTILCAQPPSVIKASTENGLWRHLTWRCYLRPGWPDFICL